MNALMPTPLLTSLRREVDRLFERISDGDVTFPALGKWNPAIDLSETDDAVIVKMEIPGVEAQDVHVTLKNLILTVRGEKREEIERKDKRFYRMECTHGKFVRSIELPVEVDQNKVTATFKDGVLAVTLAKTAEAKAVPIVVKVA